MSSPTSAISTAGRAFEMEEELDGVGGHGGDLDAIIAASRQRAETKSAQVKFKKNTGRSSRGRGKGGDVLVWFMYDECVERELGTKCFVGQIQGRAAMCFARRTDISIYICRSDRSSRP